MDYEAQRDPYLKVNVSSCPRRSPSLLFPYYIRGDGPDRYSLQTLAILTRLFMWPRFLCSISPGKNQKGKESEIRGGVDVSVTRWTCACGGREAWSLIYESRLFVKMKSLVCVRQPFNIKSTKRMIPLSFVSHFVHLTFLSTWHTAEIKVMRRFFSTLFIPFYIGETFRADVLFFTPHSCKHSLNVCSISQLCGLQSFTL